MSVLSALAEAIRSATVEVIDLTAPLSTTTPILQLPPPFGNTVPFALEEISHYDDRGPAWYWNNIHTGEHTGTHVDAPVHWVTGQDGWTCRQVPPTDWSRPRWSSTSAREVAADPDFLLEVDHVKAWESEHGALPDGGWLLLRTGWDAAVARPGRLPERRRERPAHARGRRSSAPGGWPRSRRSSGSGSRPSAPTRARRTRSTRRSRATPPCSGRASTA